MWNGSEWNPGPAGAEAAGDAIGQIQYNDGNSPAGLAASSGLVWDDTGKVLGVGGDIDLDDGGTYTTTLQTITPTAARTISFPDATGTVGLVAAARATSSSTKAGAYAGLQTARWTMPPATSRSAAGLSAALTVLHPHPPAPSPALGLQAARLPPPSLRC